MDYEDSDDELELLDLIDNPLPVLKRILVRKNPFDDYDDDQFRQRFRMKKGTALMGLNEIERDLEYPTDHNNSVTPMNQLLLTLRFLSTGTFQLVLGDLFGVDQSTVSRKVHRCIQFLPKLRPKLVNFPSTAIELQNAMQEFYNTSRFPGVIGAIDCAHGPIISHSRLVGEAFRNRKGYFSMNVQLVCEPTLYISDVVASWAGCTHDSTIFDFSKLRAKFEVKEINDGYLIGDSGYPCRNYMLTPVSSPENAAQENYNVAHVQARNSIKRLNGVLKRRFPGLKYGVRVDVKRTPPIIVAVVVFIFSACS